MDIVILIRAYVEGLIVAEDRFIEHLDSFPELEKKVVELTNRIAAGFLGAVLTTADALICESGVCKKEYHIHKQKDGKTEGRLIGKIVYFFEGKEEICRGLRKLIAPFYFGG